ncbi:DUF4160 domain-containing protein [Rhizobium sp. PAMB 3174]
MPTLVRIGNIVIRMFADDHHPPHFHIVTPDHHGAVRIADFVMIAGEMDRKSLQIALAWADENRTVLEGEWRRLNER